MLEESIKMPEDRKVIYNDILNGNLIKSKKKYVEYFSFRQII